MGAYQYVAVDGGGKEHRGVLEGDTPRHVRQLLRERQLLPVEVAEIEERERKTRRQFSLFRGISGLDLALLTRQLATLVKAGLPLDEALLAVSEHTEKPRLKSIVLGVRAKVVEGHSLASGLDEFPHAFPMVYRATVMAGEQAGQLDNVLERLADYTESRHGLRQKVVQAMVYPILLTVIALGIITVMLVVVVPKIVTVFETTGQELPIMTRVLIAISNFVQNWWFLLIAVIGIGIFAIVKLLEQEHVRRRVHGWLLRTPLLGRVTRGLNTARFTRTLSILTASGVPALEALRISASVVANLPMRTAVEEAAIRVREGGAIGRSLAQSKLFPPITIHLISSGEASGELGAMLERAANHQESEMDGLLAMMLSVLEPLLIVIMGLVVLAIVMAILLPIFQINQLVR
ncbi:MAG TPA: type II secretion system inner membrane protein GspF [Gammaproteobacteria bacterium]|nr:type II secretion system inner membrane protein GspF [Gammaproteobacteria bacterium]